MHDNKINITKHQIFVTRNKMKIENNLNGLNKKRKLVVDQRQP